MTEKRGSGGVRSRKRIGQGPWVKRTNAKKTLATGDSPGSVAFAEALDYWTYRLLDRFLSYDGKKTACTSKLAKRMKTTTKPYKIEDSNAVTVLLFLEQFTQAYDYNEVSKSVVMCLLLLSIVRSPVVQQMICLTPTNSSYALPLHHQRIDGRERIFTYNEGVDFLLKSYTADDMIAKIASEIKSFKKYNNQTAVQLPKLL